MWGANCTLETEGNEGELSVNQLGGKFQNGRPLPVYKRKLMIELACEGMKSCQISRVLKVSNGCVSKILTRFHRTGVITPKATGGSRPRILTSELISIIAELKRQNPTLFAWEIRKKLETQRACSGEHIPSVSSINRILKKSRLEVDSVHLPEQCSYSEWGSSQTPDKTFQQQTDTDMREPSHRSRTAFTPDQSQSLEKEFSSGVYPDQQTREKLSEDTKLPQNTIKVWFSNRRAKMRREQQAESANREFQGVNRPVFLGSNFFVSQTEADRAQDPFSLAYPRNRMSFPLVCMNSSTVPSCSHTGRRMPTFYREPAYHLVPSNSVERIFNGTTWSSHQHLNGPAVSMF